MRRGRRKAVRKCVDPCTNGRKFLQAIISFVPILGWLPKYNFKGYLVRDIIGGFTTGVMHVPQGSFAVVALMSGIANERILTKYVHSSNSTMSPTEIATLTPIEVASTLTFALGMITMSPTEIATLTPIEVASTLTFALGMIQSRPTEIATLTPIEVASTLTFALGMIQFATGLLRLEFLTAYFSDQLVAGFATGSACHVFTAQLDDIFGVNVPKVSGPGYIFRVSVIIS
uniref:Sulfate_transp domain-containing protein n=1 Tax=Ascaris lumbricoides TaxID=6252 RepID=A0A0M3IIU5_ASCLU